MAMCTPGVDENPGFAVCPPPLTCDLSISTRTRTRVRVGARPTAGRRAEARAGRASVLTDVEREVLALANRWAKRGYGKVSRQAHEDAAEDFEDSKVSPGPDAGERDSDSG